MMKHLSKLQMLPWRDRRVLLAAMILLPLLRLALAMAGLRHVQRWLQTPVTPRRCGGLSPESISALVGMAASHAPVRSTCLTRSMLLNWLLHRHGLASQVRIGVRVIDGNLDAHAWVECGGRPVNDTEDVSQRFCVFDGRIDPAGFPAR